VNSTPGTANYVNGTPLLADRQPEFQEHHKRRRRGQPVPPRHHPGATADQDHDYSAEQDAFNNLAMDLFPKNTGTAGSGGSGAFNTTGL